MCRLLGVVATHPATTSELLRDDLAPFLAMACEHNDGWGIASLRANGTVASEKEPLRADEAPNFRGALERTVTDTALLHLRMASASLAVTWENTHPFGDDGLAFAHNGDFVPATSLDAMIGPDLLATAGGDTDSERFYLAIRRGLDDGVPPPDAIAAAAAEVRTRARTFVSLNCLLLTPSALFAYTEHDPDSEVMRRRGPGYFALTYREEPGKVVVASAGWPQPAPEWAELPERHVLEIGRGNVKTTLHAA